jgi:succinate dehydrogenase / fumarate reductase cytochrome b subunit
MGLALVVYLIEHLVVNSQATLWLGDHGKGFVQLVNLIHSVPYLQVVEIVFIAVPLVLHGYWGVKRALSARSLPLRSDGSRPSLGFYSRHLAFRLQRISSWILLVGVVLHVLQMRFWHRPTEVEIGAKKWYLTKISSDVGLSTLSDEVGFYLCLDPKEGRCPAPLPASSRISGSIEELRDRQQSEWTLALEGYTLQPYEVLAVSPSPGVAFLLMVRDTFKQPLYTVAYTLFVLAAAYHASNGLWTFLLTWGYLLSFAGQRRMGPIVWIGCSLLGFLGLVSIWGSYWLNLRS